MKRELINRLGVIESGEVVVEENKNKHTKMVHGLRWCSDQNVSEKQIHNMRKMEINLKLLIGRLALFGVDLH